MGLIDSEKTKERFMKYAKDCYETDTKLYADVIAAGEVPGGRRMSDLRKDLLSCPNCGAPINRATMRCEYCGSVFRESMPNVLVCVEHPKIVPLQAEVFVDNYLSSLLSKEELAREVSSQLTRKIADGLDQLMEIKVKEDPLHFGTIVRGRIRVVLPSEKL